VFVSGEAYKGVTGEKEQECGDDRRKFKNLASREATIREGAKGERRGRSKI